MPFTIANADNHAKTGKLNVTAASNTTLTAYGDYYADRIRNNNTSGHERDLLDQIVKELEARHQQQSAGSYNGRLTNNELNKISIYRNLLSPKSTIQKPRTSWLKIFEESTIDETTADQLVKEARDFYLSSHLNNKIALGKIQGSIQYQMTPWYNSTAQLLAESFVLNCLACLDCVTTSLRINLPTMLDTLDLFISTARFSSRFTLKSGNALNQVVLINFDSLPCQLSIKDFDKLLLGGAEALLEEPNVIQLIEQSFHWFSFKSYFQHYVRFVGRA